jgi:hypothetical protein
MAAKLTRLTHKIAIQLFSGTESYTICISRSRRPVRKLLDTPTYIVIILAASMDRHEGKVKVKLSLCFN